MKENTKIKDEALKYFTKHYPCASKREIDKQVLDWQNKTVSSGKLVDFFVKRVGDVKGKKILDVGFGSGGVSVAFARSGGVVSGVDVDQELKDVAERLAKESNLNIDFKIYNGVDLPFPADYFDFIVCSSVLEHVSFPEKVLNDMLRVLKPGGRMLLSLPNKYAPKETHTLAYFVSYMPRKIADQYLKILRRSPLEHDNLHFYSYFDVMRMLKESDYKHEVLHKSLKEMAGAKRLVASALKKISIHYTVFLRQLIFIIEKK